MCGVMHLMSSKIFRPTRNEIVQFQCDLDENIEEMMALPGKDPSKVDCSAA